MNLIQYLVVLASYVQISSGACYEVTSNSSIWSMVLVSVRISQRSFLLMECSLALKLFILDTTTAYLIGLSCPNFFTYLSLSFFENTMCLVLLLCLWFLSFLCHNFLTFLSQTSSDSTLVAIGYLFVSIPRRAVHYLWVSSGPFGDLLLFKCFYLNFLVRMVVSGVTAR